MRAILSIGFWANSVGTWCCGSEVWSKRSTTFVAILRAFDVLGFAPFTANHLFGGNPGLRSKTVDPKLMPLDWLNANYSSAKMSVAPTLALFTLSTGVSFTPDFSPLTAMSHQSEKPRSAGCQDSGASASRRDSERFTKPLTWFLHQSRSCELKPTCSFSNPRTS